ncbi:MAG TPA: Z1 domain-containing protein, partial [Flavobacterium sp.]|nr:Z1 domain-containing protein [Flavobacterium sp.]
MIISSALAIDNGFRIVVIFTSNNVKLVEQTYNRFDTGARGILIRSSADRKNEKRWIGDVDHIRNTLSNYTDYGLILICQKESKHLEDVKFFLEKINAPKYPVLLLDDEADQATPDTNLRKRAMTDPATLPSKTFSQIVWTPEEESILQLLPHHIFVQVTATPYALLLQNLDGALKPRFCELLEPGEDYTGGEYFFEDRHIEDDGSPPLVFVNENELELRESSPEGLTKAVHFFLLSSIVQEKLESLKKFKVKNFLCHTSFKKEEHSQLSELIKKIIDQIGQDVNAPNFDRNSITSIKLSEAIEELSKTIPKDKIPDLETLIKEIKYLIPSRQILVINSTVDSNLPEKGLNFLIGGNILGRGLTIENLLVTYYMRQPRISQMDTMLQHARMYGYRRKSLPFLRVFLPDELATRFNKIHGSERDLRNQIKEKGVSKIAVTLAGNLRPTRTGVLDPRNITAFVSGRQFYPHRPEYRKSKVLTVNSQIETFLKSLFESPEK